MKLVSLWKRLGVFLLSMLLLAGLCVTAYAAGVMSSAPVMRWGQIRSIDSDGAYHVEDSLGMFTVRVPEASFVDAQTGAAYDAGKVRQGDVIKIWFDSDLYDAAGVDADMNALVVVTNFKDDNVYSGPEYFETMGHVTEDTSLHVSEVQVINGEEDRSIKFVGTTKIFAYGTNAVMRPKDIQPGSRLMVWKDGHGAIVRIIVLPYNYNAAISWNVDSGVCTVNGEDIGVKIAIVSEKVSGGSLDQVYLPLKAVSSKMGFIVKQDAKKGLVIVDDETDSQLSMTYDKDGNMKFLSGKRIEIIPDADVYISENNPDELYVPAGDLCDYFHLFFSETRG